MNPEVNGVEEGETEGVIQVDVEGEEMDKRIIILVNNIMQ